MKRAFLISVISFAVTLAIIFGIRASADALAVVLGVVLGVIASVPATFLVTYMLTRPRFNNGTPSQQAPQQPPIVVINAPDKPLVSSPSSLPVLSSAPQTRKWTVIGDVETES